MIGLPYLSQIVALFHMLPPKLAEITAGLFHKSMEIYFQLDGI